MNTEINKPSDLDLTAKKLAKECPITGNFGNTQIDYYGLTRKENRDALWDSFKDKKILDIAAGLSNLTARLIEKGANAYALDYGYKDMDGFLIGLRDRKGSWTSADPMFIRSIHQDPKRYVYGVTHDLPFKDNSFDAVLSHFGVFGVVDLDYDLLQASVNEAVRIVKPCGVIMFGPFQGILREPHKKNQSRLLIKLKQREDIDVYAQFPRALGASSIDKLGKLTIFKN